MTLHESQEFAEAINTTAAYFGMRSAFVEKDYWVTFALRNLAYSPEVSRTVFKGGTSLSKVYECTSRFSEDIDLAIITEKALPQSEVKKQLKAVELAASKGLTLLEDPPPIKKGKNRFSCYGYPRRTGDSGLPITKPYIKLEISSFTNPVPHVEASINSYVGKYFEHSGYSRLIQSYSLEPFPLKVLSIERTLCEKLLSLIRLSYRGSDELQKKIRHFHDLTLMKTDERIIKMLAGNDHSILYSAFSDDKNTTTFQGEWIKKPFTEAPLFTEYDAIWESIKGQYHSELPGLSWAASIPTDADVRTTIFQLRDFVHAFKDQ